MRHLPKKLTNSSLYKKIEKTFNDEVTTEDYILHTFLLWSNIFLSILAILEIFFIHSEKFFHYAHVIEITFGILFLFEFVLRFIFSYFKNSVYFKWSLLLQLVIIISLIAPHLFGNLAILRLIRSLKIIKIFILRQEQLELSGEKVDHHYFINFIHKINHKTLRRKKTTK